MGIPIHDLLGDPGNVFSGYTLYDYHLSVKAHESKIKGLYHLEAFNAANIMNVWLEEKDRITPAHLLGEHKEKIDNTQAINLLSMALKKKA